MRCPKCNHQMGSSVQLTVLPIEVYFNVQFSPDGRLKRTTEITGKEVVEVDRIADTTHRGVCPNCATTFLPSQLVHIPRCAKCGEERPRMTAEQNTCQYEGLVCLACMKKSAVGYCMQCTKRATCRLGQRVLSTTEKAEEL